MSNDGTGGSCTRDIASEVAERRAWTNPEEAAEWIVNLPEITSHYTKPQRVADRWASANPQAAAEWAVELPESDVFAVRPWKELQTDG